MASQPLPPPVTARLDRDGRLVAADGPLRALQEQAGARIGQQLALPQLATIARLAARLRVAVSRPALVASESEDIDLWVTAEPDEEGVTLTLERWSARPASRQRWSAEVRPAEEAAESGHQLVIDAELRLVSVSPSLLRRLGATLPDLAGAPLARLLRPLEDEEGNLPLLAALAARAPFTGQAAEIRATGERVLMDGAPRLEGEAFAGYVVSFRQEEAALPLAGLPLDDLLSEPLAAIIEEAQEIAGRSEGPLRSDYASYGTDIAAAARHLMDLLAAMSPQDAGAGARLGEQRIDLAELVLEAAGLIQPQAAERGVVLDIAGAPRLAARGQPRAVTQILLNLIGNAVRFSPSGGEVSILLADGEEASVTVVDRGPGVAPADRNRIFERFEQSGERPGKAGLGLAISRRLAREMGGEVELLESDGGATFRLRLPAA
jgi:signal transduction histidine kinase